MIEEASMKRTAPRFFSIPPETKDGCFSPSATFLRPQRQAAGIKR
jgi:hypothetical protein